VTDVRPSVNFDHYDDDFARDPFPSLAQLRQHWPVAHSEAHGGFWLVSRYADVQELAHRPEVFSSRYTSVPNDIGLGDFLIPPVQLDPPEHGRVKRLLSKAFVPAKVARFETGIRAYVTRLLEGLAARPGFDASHDFARLVPTAVVGQLLGAPDSVELLSGWVGRMLEQAASDIADATAAGMELFGFVNAIVSDRREQPGSDVISELLATEVEGDTLSDEEITLAGVLLVLAGVDTTWSTLGTTIHHLATNQAHQSRLRR